MAERWIPIIATQQLVDKAGNVTVKQPSYLLAVRDSLRKYYADLNAVGITFFRPVIVEHRVTEYAAEMNAPGPGAFREGRRSGDVLDADVRMFDVTTRDAFGPNARWTLWLKIRFRDEAQAAIDRGELEHMSIHTLETYTDPQTQITYSPFLWEVSETTTPMIKDFSVQMGDPETTKRVGLCLAETMETEMNEEQVMALVNELLTAGLTPLVQRLDEIESKMMAAGEEVEAAPVEATDEQAETTEQAPEAQAPAPVQALGVAASDVAQIRAELADMKAALINFASKRTTALPTFQPGVMASSKPKLSADEAWNKAQSELGPNARQSEIAKRAQSLM